MNLATYTNSYRNQIIHEKNRKSEKKDSPFIPRYVGIPSIMYGTKVRYCLKPKLITYMKTIRKTRLYKFIRVAYLMEFFLEETPYL